MDFFEMIHRRRSVRRFDGNHVEEEHIAKILGAALTAPSSKNSRSSSFMVVENTQLMAAISQMRDFGSAFLKDAPLGIVVMGDPALADTWAINSAISATYIQLAAEALGLGSCWVHVDGRLCETNSPDSGSAEDYLKGILPIPQERRILCVIAIGHPDKKERQVREFPDAGESVIRL